MSQPLVLGAMAVAVADTSINYLSKSTSEQVRTPPIKVIVGGLVVTVGLLVISEQNEKFADSMALLIMLATVFGPNGNALAKAIDKVAGTSSVKSVSRGKPASTPVLKLS